ncbi:DUF342 domain-containing protein [Roseateles sp. DAIF2]|uniref:hypothetical protein n=1 Tax=Roseateles sp. DAIF2 TaxID=2714952 RepID=UPI0018A287A2|nr:hypothetical protein [Roseateles sp. DAIF2]QPF73519.1 DUF342 domain-containing protein [Roseateles sp. DAIF2]
MNKTVTQVSPPVTKPCQQGVASVLFMMLLGLGLMALVLGAASQVRGSQSQSQTVHAQTQAQLRAWNGAEALRQYLAQSGAAQASTIPANAPVAFQGLQGINATVTAVTAADPLCQGGTRVDANLRGASGGANSLLQLVYCATGQPGGGGQSGNDAVNIKGNLDLSGDLKVLGKEKARMIVDGKVQGAGSLNGIHELYATGNVTLGGSTSIDTVFSEGNISLSGSGNYRQLEAMGDITLSGGVKASTLFANGKISLESNEVPTLSAIGDVKLGSNAKVTDLKTKGSVVAVNSQISGSALVQGSYTEGSNGAVASGQYGQNLTVPGWNTQVRMNHVPGLVVALTPRTQQTISRPRVDVYEYRAAANYRFERDTDNRTIVTVNQVEGIPDGRYFLAGQADKQDWLCRSGANFSASDCVAKICAGHSEHNSCLSYSNGTWSLAGQSMAPGVAWFEGNLSAGQGSYANSFMASGNITTAGNNTTEALNYAGYAKVCNNSLFPGLRPKGYCKAGSAELTPQPLGNIAFAAGGIGPSGKYSGGRIDLSAANHVYGDVLAGDLLQTGGSTVVHGHVVAARMGNGTGNNSFGASTTIDLRNLPSTFTPGGGQGGNAAPPAARILWSRYR